MSHSKNKTLDEVLEMRTLEEIESWEKSQDDSNDIYKVKGRIKNHATMGGGHLMPAGEGLVNSFAHVAKSIYDFAETLTNPEEKARLIKLMRRHETMPSQVIAMFAPKKAK